MSDNFDPDEYLAEAPETEFDPDAYLAEERAPAGEDKNTTLGAIKGGAIGGTAGTLGGKLIQGVTAVGKYVGEHAGNLKPEQVDFIKNDPQFYLDAKKNNKYADLVGQFNALKDQVAETKTGAAKHIIEGVKNVVEDVNKAAYSRHQDAIKSLESPDAKGISKDRYKQIVGEAVSKSSAVGDLTPEMKSQRINEVLNAYRPQVEALQSKSLMLETQMQGLPDGSVKFELQDQKAAVDAQLDKLKSDVINEAQSASAKSTGFPEEIRKVTPSLENKYLDKAYTQQLQAAVDLVDNTPGDSLSAKELGGKFGKVKQLQEGVKLDRGPGKGVVNDFDALIARGVNDEVKSLNLPFKVGQEAASRAIGKLKSMGYNTTNDFDENGSIIGSDSENKKITKIMSDPETNPEAFKQLKKDLNDTYEFSQRQPLSLAQERLEQAARLEKTLNEYKNSDTGELKLDKVSGKVRGKDTDFGKLSSAIDEASTIAPQAGIKSGEDFLNRLNATNISDQIGDVNVSSRTKGKALGALGAKIGGLGALGAGAGAPFGQSTAGAVAGAGLGLFADVYGNQIQEAAALGKNYAPEVPERIKELAKYIPALQKYIPDNVPVGKIASATNSALPGVLGLGGAFIGGINAASASTPEERRLSPTAAALGIAGETANPIPMTDVISGMQEGQEAALNAQKSITPEDAQFQQDIALTGDLGASPALGVMNANPIEAARNAGFLKGYTSPIPALASIAKDTIGQGLENVGTQLSNDARSRMEQNMNARTAPVEKMQAGSKSLQQATPEQLQELIQSFTNTKGAESFVTPLQNAAQASSEEEKQARLWGLYQQPAFRKLLNRGNQN